MVKKISKQLYDYFSELTYDELDSLTGKQIREMGFVDTDRTGRRHKQWFVQGMAAPEDDYTNQRVTSDFIESIEDEEEFDVDEFIEWAEQEVARARRDDPITTHDRLDFHTEQPVAVIFPSCMHLGGRYTAYRSFKDIFDRVKQTPRIYWGSMGDDIEGFTAQFRDVRAVSDQLMSVSRQKKVLSSILKQLADKNRLLFGVSSQHGGQWISRQTGEDPIKQIFLELGVPYYDGMGYVKFVVGQNEYNIAVAHKFKGFSMYNPSHPQARALRWEFPNADAVIMGDRHFPSVQQFAVYGFEVEANNRNSPYVTLVQSGTAKTGPDPYTIRGWSKGVLGWPILIFSPDEHNIKFTWDLEDVDMWLN